MTYTIRVLTSCTGNKKYKPDNQLTQQDFINGLEEHERELEEYRTSAGDLYTGQQHLRLMKYFNQINNVETKVEIWIVSAGYGLIQSSTPILPYECTFQGMKKDEIREWSNFLQIPNDVYAWFQEPANVNLILLGEAYLYALQLSSQMPLLTPAVFFTSSKTASIVPKYSNASVIPLVNADAKRFSCGLVGLKGELGGRAILRLSHDMGHFLPQLQSDRDTALIAIDLEEFRPKKKIKPKPILKSYVEKVVQLPQQWYGFKHRKKLMFYIPDWDDMVDLEYNFVEDTHSGGQGVWGNQVYSHQIYDTLTSDGLLVSKAVVSGKQEKLNKISELGIHTYMRLPKEVSIMGDCGAFSYLLEETPPYTIEEVIAYYTNCGFNYGISLDHLLFGASDEAGQLARYQLTIHNAEAFIKEHHKQNPNWEAIGALQGMNVQQYADAARQYIDMGYKYLAIGGQVRSRTQYIYQIISAIHEVIPSDVKLHLLGVARLEAISQMVQLGVTSVDSASYLRQAWIRAGQNYIGSNGELYTAIRIPQSKGFIEHHQLTDYDSQQVQFLESQTLESLRLYAAGHVSIDDTIEKIVQYTNAIEKPVSAKMLTEYRISLEHRPWENCTCNICRQAGIEVILFRGNNRNRRRGFHNNYIAYQEIQNLALGGIPRLSWKKAGIPSTLPIQFDYK
jgi:hypothetical protein